MSEHAERLESRGAAKPGPAAKDLLGQLELRVQGLVGRHREANEATRELREQLADRDRMIRELSGKLEAGEKLRAEVVERVESLIGQVDQLARARA